MSSIPNFRLISSFRDQYNGAIYLLHPKSHADAVEHNYIPLTFHPLRMKALCRDAQTFLPHPLPPDRLQRMG